MKLQLPYHALRLIPYEGAGNKTPVVDLRAHLPSPEGSPQEVRSLLEQDIYFRRWLQDEGKKLNADTVMIYYQTSAKDYDFVTFIGEPHAPLSSRFSTMCGNGIRALALHIMLTTPQGPLRQQYAERGIKIWAGMTRRVEVDSLNPKSQSGLFRVSLGTFTTSRKAVKHYLAEGDYFEETSLTSVKREYLPEEVRDCFNGIGFNGSEDGEPHLVFLVQPLVLRSYLNRLGYSKPLQTPEDVLQSLQLITMHLGWELTFAQKLFPSLINVNVGMVLGQEIFMSTHERNLSSGRKSCLYQYEERGKCRCNTLACGTGGAALASVARATGLVTDETITTRQPGGDLRYRFLENDTLMIGPAQKLVEEKGGEIKGAPFNLS